ncbi:MAG: class I SAM-dependent methyltransferase [Bacteroidetes bacterium]|nr:MAG: class I SAM-dependent methyltransferase [Bacteroidota bacterium]
MPARSSVGWLAGYLVAVGVMAVSGSDWSWWPVFVVATLVAGGLHVIFWHRNALRLRDVLVGAVLLRLLFFWWLPGLSDDAFRYVWDGWIQTHEINPYLHRPEDAALSGFQASPIYEWLNSASFYSVYPPVSQLLFRVGGQFMPMGWEVAYFVIKGLFVLLELAGVWLLGRLVEARGVLLYAWHPIVLVEVAGQAHTEAAMVGLLLAALWFAARERPAGAAVALTLAGWVKIYPLLLLPLLWRRFGWRAIWTAGVVSLVVWLPYADLRVPAHIAESLDLYVRYFEFNAGPYYAVKGVMRWLTGEDWSKQIGPAFRWLYLLLVPVLYALDWKRGWTLHRAMLYLMGGYLLLATTVHPWYLLAVLPLLAWYDRPPWAWYVLSLASVGTYLLYPEDLEGDILYRLFVWLSWGGGAVVGLIQYSDPLLQWLQKHRARHKYEKLREHLPERILFPSARVLDLGAGEGYVGALLHERHGAEVILADVIDLNRTKLPHVRYDGHLLPFADGAFDATLLVFVLHHAERPDIVIREALRVTRGPVLIWESVYESATDHRVLRRLDGWANRLRSGGAMRDQEAYLQHRTVPDWLALIRRCAGTHPVSVEVQRLGLFPHKQVLFVVQKNPLLQKRV